MDPKTLPGRADAGPPALRQRYVTGTAHMFIAHSNGEAIGAAIKTSPVQLLHPGILTDQHVGKLTLVIERALRNRT